jgi:hypothetical protein
MLWLAMLWACGAARGCVDARRHYWRVLQEVLASEAWSGFVAGGRSRLELARNIDRFSFHVDSSDRVFVVVTTTAYPVRLVSSMSGTALLDSAWLAARSCARTRARCCAVSGDDAAQQCPISPVAVAPLLLLQR